MDTDMELTEKTTILFPPDLYNQLAALAEKQNSSVGELVREACRQRYFFASRDERFAAVAELSALSLPVASPAQMKSESIPNVEPLP